MTAAAASRPDPDADAEDERTQEAPAAHPSPAAAAAAAAELRDDACSARRWGRLVALTQGLPSIELEEEELRLGRGHAKGDKRVSKVHCRIWREAGGSGPPLVLVLDQSLNGSMLRGAALERGKPVALAHGDVLVLGPCAAGFPVYVYQAAAAGNEDGTEDEEDADGEGNQGQGQTGRKRERRQGSEAAHAQEDKQKKKKVNKMTAADFTDSLKCSICWNLLHDTVSVSPCLHSFCNSCFSDWYRRSKSSTSSTSSASCKCPQCRAAVVSVGRNHTVRGLVEDVLRADPALRRPQADVDKMDKNALVKSDIMRLVDPDLRPVSSTDALVHSDGDTQSEDAEAGSCRQCEDYAHDSTTVLPAGASTFRCGVSTMHVSCSACFHFMPCRPDLDVPQSCVACQLVYCDAYWRSQNLSAAPGFPAAAGCPMSAALKPVREWVVPDLPAHTHRGNEVEKDITRRYLTGRQVTVQDLITQWLVKLDSGEVVELPRFPTGIQPATLTSTSPVCGKCQDALVDDVLYRFRCSIPRTELPAGTDAPREDCWYGYSCFTQFNNPDHARRFNHVCEAQPGRAVRRSGPFSRRTLL